jgi:hypothetical protein
MTGADSGDGRGDGERTAAVNGWPVILAGCVLVLVVLAGVAAGAGQVGSPDAAGGPSDAAGTGPAALTHTASATATPVPAPVAACSVSATTVEVGEQVTLDASASENADSFQYAPTGASFGDFTSQETTTVSYGEVGTYTPQVKVWSEPTAQRESPPCGS